MQYAADLIRRLPPALVTAARDPYGARALIYAMLINDEAEPRKIQLDRLAEQADPRVNSETNKLLPVVDGLDAEGRLPLVDMTVPALRDLTLDQYRAFKANVDVLVKADQRIDIFEWSLRRIVFHHLDPQFERTPAPRVAYYALKRLNPQCEVLLSALAYVGNTNEAAARGAFDAGAVELDLPGVQLVPLKQCNLDSLGRALDELRKIAPRLKRQVLNASAACISADRKITVHEAELLRAVSSTLDCPMPPLLAGPADDD